MRSKIVTSLLLISTLAIGSAALAATTATQGTIKSIDAKALSVTLQDGTTYHLPAGFALGTFKVGEKVKLSWDMQGQNHVVTGMTPAS